MSVQAIYITCISCRKLPISARRYLVTEDRVTSLLQIYLPKHPRTPLDLVNVKHVLVRTKYYSKQKLNGLLDYDLGFNKTFSDRLEQKSPLG